MSLIYRKREIQRLVDLDYFSNLTHVPSIQTALILKKFPPEELAMLHSMRVILTHHLPFNVEELISLDKEKLACLSLGCTQVKRLIDLGFTSSELIMLETLKLKLLIDNDAQIESLIKSGCLRRHLIELPLKALTALIASENPEPLYYSYLRAILFGIFIGLMAKVGVFTLMGLSSTLAFSILSGIGAMTFMLSIQCLEAHLFHTRAKSRPNLPELSPSPPFPTQIVELNDALQAGYFPSNSAPLTVTTDPRANDFQPQRNKNQCKK